MIAQDYFSLDQTDSPEDTASASPHNRNLSRIVSTIRDDGPSVLEMPSPEPQHDDEPAPVLGVPTQQRPRIRALPGASVMLKVAGVLLAMVLLAAALLLASGKYPAMDASGLQLAELSAGYVRGQSDLQDSALIHAAPWFDYTDYGLTQLMPASHLDFPAAVADQTTGPAGQQAEIMARLDQLTATVAALQASLDQEQARRVTEQETRQAEQALELKAVQALLVELQQQTSSPELPAQAQMQDEHSQAQAASQASESWVVNVATFANKDAIKALQQRLEQQDIHTELQRTEVQGKQHYRLRVTGFATGAEARQYAARLAEQANLAGAWISKR